MGLEPEQFEGGAGEMCYPCWGGGKPWEGQGIPAVVFANFSGIIACPEWCDAPNGVFTLAQDPAVHCRWKTTIPNWCGDFDIYISWVLAEAQSILVIKTVPVGAFYFRDVQGPCQTNFTNEGVACFEGHWVGYNGIGVIT